MRGKILLTSIIIAAFLGSFVAQWYLTKRGNGDIEMVRSSERIVSLSPSVTETLFELGLGDRVVGVTSFCKYPEEALNLPKVGAYLDPNYEAIVALTPDLVILRKEFEEAKMQLEDLGIRSLTVDHNHIEGILDSFTAIGKQCGTEPRAREVVEDLRDRITRIQEATIGLPKPKVMVSVEREMGTGSIKGVYVAGRDGFYDKMIRTAGGVSVFEDTGIPFPNVSMESIMRADPEIIVDIVPDHEQRDLDEAAMKRDWRKLSEVAAVKNGRVYVLTQDFMVIPGPRFILVIEEFARIIHPEIEW